MEESACRHSATLDLTLPRTLLLGFLSRSRRQVNRTGMTLPLAMQFWAFWAAPWSYKAFYYASFQLALFKHEVPLKRRIFFNTHGATLLPHEY